MSTMQEPRQVSVTLPAITDGALERLASVQGEFERIRMDVDNVVGLVDTTHWEARLTEPPTIEQIGSLWLFIRAARDNVAVIADALEELEAAMPELDSLRNEEALRVERTIPGPRHA